MGQNSITANGPPRLSIAIPKDENGVAAAALWEHPLVQQKVDMILVPVVAGDIDGVNYVAGSAGQIKTIEAYPSGSSSGDASTVTTFLYENAALPIFITKITTIDSEV